MRQYLIHWVITLILVQTPTCSLHQTKGETDGLTLTVVTTLFTGFIGTMLLTIIGVLPITDPSQRILLLIFNDIHDVVQSVVT